MLYGSQKRFDKNGDGKLKGAEWQRWYQYAYGDEIEAKEKVFTALSDEVNSELDVKWSEMKSYDESGSGIVFLMLLLAMVALACFNIWRKLRKKSRNMY